MVPQAFPRDTEVGRSRKSAGVPFVEGMLRSLGIPPQEAQVLGMGCLVIGAFLRQREHPHSYANVRLLCPLETLEAP